MTPDMTKKTPIPKRVLNSVQRNVAVLVELLKAEESRQRSTMR